MGEPLISEERTWTGFWWQPGDEKNAMPGILKYHPNDGVRLHLIGGWGPDVFEEVSPGVSHLLDEIREWPILFGMAENQEISLLDCSPGKTKSWGMGPPAKQTIHVQTALTGVHIHGREEEVFTKCHVSVEDLTTWSNSSVLHSSRERKEWRSTGVATIEAKPVEDPSVTVNRVVTSLRHLHTLPHPERSRGRTLKGMQECRVISFEPEEPWSLSTALEHAKMVQDLLSLALHRPCGVLWIQLYLPPNEQEQMEGFPNPEREINFYSRPTVVADPSADAIMPHQALFTCEHLPFEEVWPKWYEVREQCLEASNMILGLRYAPPRYLELRLLSATGAAEVLHRALEKTQETKLQPPLSADEFATLRQTLLQHTPSKHQDWVKTNLRNQVTLRQRLQDLSTLPASEAMESLVPDVERWAAVTTQARNTLTHEGHTDRKTIDEIIAAVRVTSAVVVMNLLQALGVPSAQQAKIINDHPELSQTANLARTHLTSN